MEIEKTPLGYEIKTQGMVALLGNAHSKLSAIKAAYPQFRFCRVKQTHSDTVVTSLDESTDYQIEADAQMTPNANLGLCVITADCVPVLLFDPVSSVIAGVHAGWRGVASNIIPKTIKAMESSGAQARHIQVIIGPHIQKSSFEVGMDVGESILRSLGPLSSADRSLYFEQKSESKALVDLNMIVKTQIQNAGIEFDHLFNLHIDTVTDLEFHSFRRDKEKSGRQISFICRT